LTHLRYESSVVELLTQAIRKELFDENGQQRLLKERHLVYLRSGLKGLNKHFTALDARYGTLRSVCVSTKFHAASLQSPMVGVLDHSLTGLIGRACH